MAELGRGVSVSPVARCSAGAVSWLRLWLRARRPSCSVGATSWLRLRTRRHLLAGELEGRHLLAGELEGHLLAGDLGSREIEETQARVGLRCSWAPSQRHGRVRGEMMCGVGVWGVRWACYSALRG
jgi:hypothetical protein